MRLALAAALVLVPLSARADSFTDQLDQARKDYQQGDLSTAVSDLEFAIQELRGKLGTAYLATFPPAPAGWTGRVQDESAAVCRAAAPCSSVPTGRRWRGLDRGPADDRRRLPAGLAAMFMNPAMLAAQPGAKRVRVGKDNAVVTYDPSDRTAKLMLDVGGKVTLMLDGKDLANSDPLVQLANASDIKKCARSPVFKACYGPGPSLGAPEHEAGEGDEVEAGQRLGQALVVAGERRQRAVQAKERSTTTCGAAGRSPASPRAADHLQGDAVRGGRLGGAVPV